MSLLAADVSPAADRRNPLEGALPAGAVCGGFEIVRVLGTGGFGIVYLARDPALDRDIAVKEYMPRRFACRDAAGCLAPRADAAPAVLAAGRQAFLAEARLLARFEHPSLVQVYRAWEDNATAYMAMPRLHGMTLHRARRRAARVPEAAWIRGALRPLLDALALLHGAGVWHRDVAPDNILLPPAGPLVLLDMGAARDAHDAGGDPSAGIGVAKRGYAPIEQYGGGPGLQQGPWTDLYGLGAVLHFLLHGRPPPPPQQGGFDPDAAPASARHDPGLLELHALMAWMLEPLAARRPQSVAELREHWDRPRAAGAGASGAPLAIAGPAR